MFDFGGLKLFTRTIFDIRCVRNIGKKVLALPKVLKVCTSHGNSYRASEKEKEHDKKLKRSDYIMIGFNDGRTYVNKRIPL